MNKNKKTRVAIYIDGSNLYHKLKDLKVEKTMDFNYFGLCSLLAKERIIFSCNYYVGTVRAKEGDILGQTRRSNQQRLFSNLKKQGIIIKQGYLMENNGVFHEKGVDVQMAVDLLTDAYDNLYDVAVLISSDTDLIPAIKKVKILNKKIEYVGFFHNPSFALKRNASLSKLLLRDDLEQFISNS